jgi:DNA-binding response OmpR family regulator
MMTRPRPVAYMWRMASTRSFSPVIESRTRIFDAVWNEQYDGLSNTLEVHVKELRKKLEAFGPRVIQTRRGRGYLLEMGESDEP